MKTDEQVKPDFSGLDWHQFERLCGALLAAEGWQNLREFGRPGAPDRGIDWVFDSLDGKRGIAQVKWHLRPLPSAYLRKTIIDLENGLELCEAQEAFLIISGRATKQAQATLPEFLTLWDGARITELIGKHESVRRGLSQLLASQEAIDKLFEGLLKPTPTLDDRSQDLLSKLDAVPVGKQGWRRYEDICVEILNHAFVPPLRPPIIQSGTEDGLDRRDAIYPIGRGNAFWESIKHEYRSRMVVAEFKNYSEPIGQTEVESLQQYLLPKARRSFGLLCSRFPPSDSALKARRRAWMLAENIILFLSDDDLKEIVHLAADDQDPSSVLDAQIDDFFITLAP